MDNLKEQYKRVNSLLMRELKSSHDVDYRTALRVVIEKVQHELVLQ